MPQSIERGQLRARSEKHQDGLTVPVADWEFIKSKIREFDVSTGLFSALGWGVCDRLCAPPEIGRSRGPVVGPAIILRDP